MRVAAEQQAAAAGASRILLGFVSLALNAPNVYVPPTLGTSSVNVEDASAASTIAVHGAQCICLAFVSRSNTQRNIPVFTSHSWD